MRKFFFTVLILVLYSVSARGQCSTTANFTYSYTACSTIQFVDASHTSANDTLVKWQWKFGAGDTASGPVVTHTFIPGSDVQVRLVVTAEDTSGNECKDTTYKSISIRTLPSVTVASDPNPAYLNVAPTFTGTSNRGIRSWQWIFGDGDTAYILQQVVHRDSVVHQYRDTGSYHVILHVVDTTGCANDNSVYVQKIDPIPSVDFSWSPDPAATVDNIQFKGTSDASASATTIAWHWNFGDGDILNGQNPTHSYKAVGTYHVTLSILVNDSKGSSSDSITKTVNIDPLPAPDFSYSVSCLGDRTYFTDSSTTPVGTIQTWKWYFGDGDSMIVHSPDNPDVTHVYVTKKVYPVTLLTINSQGYQRSITKQITVVPKPTAFFTFNDTCYTNPTSFHDQSNTNGGAAITSWQWDFGDGNSANVKDTMHTYAYPGSYPVTLSIQNADGCRDTVRRSVVMDSLPAVDFEVSSDTVCQYGSITFSGQGTDIHSWDWNFGDGDSSSYQNTTHSYSSMGPDTVTLTVRDLKGCSSAAYHKVYVNPTPVANFDFTILCKGDTTCFLDSSDIASTGNIKSWNWDFGDSTSSDVQHPDHYYHNQNINYHANLTVTSNRGCSSTVTRLIIFDSLPSPDFSVANACMNDSTVFTDHTTSPGASYIKSRKWYFGDGDSLIVTDSSKFTAGHIYRDITTYNVKLITLNSFGKVDSITKQITVHHKPLADFTFNRTCVNMPITFTDVSKKDGGSDLSAWYWNFGDSPSGTKDTSTLKNPTHAMSYPGDHPVQLVVSNTDGCSDTIVKNVVADSLPVADFTVQKDTSCFGQRNHLFGTGKNIVLWHWDFGDGSAEFTTNYDTASHIFLSPGSQTITLSVVDTEGCIVSIEHPAIVDTLPQPGFTFLTAACDQPTQFYHTTQQGSNPIRIWNWNFGDLSSGTADTSSSPDPTHLYASNDSTYQVKLIVMNFNGCVDSITKPVKRNSCLEVSYGVNTSTGCSNNPVYFENLSSLNTSKGSITGWDWNFGDSSKVNYTAIRDSVLHVYDTAGTYDVTLKVHAEVNNIPFSETFDSIIRIYRPPVANFGFTNPCSNRTVYFRDSTKTYDSNLNTWQWTFNDPYSTDNSSGMQDPVHLYDSAGSYPAQLIVTDLHHCRDTLTKPVLVHATPTAAFSLEPNYNGITGQALLNNLSTGASSYFWEFGDGDTSTETNPVYQYHAVGIFKIFLTATSKYSCSDTASTVYDLTAGLYVPNSFAPGSDIPGVETFKPIGVHLKKYQIQIYSLWGDLLWESTKLNANGEPVEGWDGTYKGQPMPAGNYIWRIKAKFLDRAEWKGSDNGDGNKKTYGTLLLIR